MTSAMLLESNAGCLQHFTVSVMQAIKPDAPLPASVMGGAYGGFFQSVKNAIDELAGVALFIR
jgi:hypothetical protein